MRPHHYFGIGLRIFAIVLFVYALRQSLPLLTVLFTGSLNGMDVSILLFSGTFVIPLILAIACWFFPMTISKKIINTDLDLEIEPINYQSLLTVFILAIGLFLTFYVISDIVYWLTYSNLALGNGGLLDPDSKAAILSTAIETLVAFTFICKAKTISHHLMKFTQ